MYIFAVERCGALEMLSLKQGLLKNYVNIVLYSEQNVALSPSRFIKNVQKKTKHFSCW